jgi:hypothetical protein
MTDCVHYWIIEIAAGPHSDGVCQRCGAIRQFDNSFGPTIGISLEDEKAYRWRDIRIREIVGWKK